MSTIPPIQVKVEADTTGLKTGLDQAKAGIKGIDDSVKTANNGMANFTANLKRVGTALGVTFAAAKIVDFAKQSVLASSDMNESLSKVQVVFGNTAQSVIDFSKTSASAMGMSSQETLEAAGTYGNLFQALGVTKDKSQEMSVNMVKLAADLGSFNNMSVTDSLNALRSGLSGETEPLKRFGISLNDTILKNKAFAMGFGEIKGVMDPAIKSQVIYATVMEQTTKAQGDYLRTAEGAANTMKSLSAQFQNAKVVVGDLLMPAFKALLSLLKVLIPVLEAIAKFFKDNGDAIKMYVTILATLTAGFLAYKAVVIVTTAVSAVHAAVLAAQARGFTLAQIAAFNFKVAIYLLNAAMKANPIGVLITALTVVGTLFVMAWKKSETFRGVVIKVVQAIYAAFAKMIEIVGKFFSALGKVPGMGWAKSVGKGLDDISAKINTAGKNLSDLKSNFKGMGNVSMSASGVGVSSQNGVTTVDKAADSAALAAAKAAAAAAKKQKEKDAADLIKYKKQVVDIYKDMNDVILSANEDAAKALKERNDKMAKAQINYNEAVAEANKRHIEADLEANKRYDEEIISIKKDYADKTFKLKKDLDKKLSDLEEAAAKKSADLTKSASEKQLGIVQQSMDRLRNAFAAKTGFNLMESFTAGKSVDSLLSDLRAKLSAAKELQANAAALAGLGYSQIFIEEVVKNGPEAGNEIAKALKAASPEAQAELRSLYGAVDDISNNGLNKLASTMNSGGRLATQELMDAYSQVAVDLKASLAEVDSQLQASMAEANAAYLDAMAEAKVTRDEKIAEADKQLMEALTKSKKDLDESLAEATKNLQEALIDAQKSYSEAIDEINAATQKKLEELKTKLAEVAALMAALGAAKAAAAAMAQAPVYTPIVASPSASTQTTTTPTTNTTVNITGVNLNDPYNTSSQVINAIRFGNVVVPTAPSALAAGESGAIGAASIKARSYELNANSSAGRVGR